MRLVRKAWIGRIRPLSLRGMNVPLQRAAMSTRDPDQGVAVAREIYDDVHFGAVDADRFLFAVSATAAGPLTAGTVRGSGGEAKRDLRGADADERALLVVTRQGGAPIGVGDGRRRRVVEGSFLTPLDSWTGWEDLRASTLGIEERTVVEVARTATRRDDLRLRFDDWVPLSPALEALWRSTSAHVARLLGAAPSAELPPLAVRSLTDVTAWALLTTFPNSALDLLNAGADDAGRAVSAALRRALQFIDENAHRPIGVTDVAAAARLSVRALQEGFRRELGTTPSARLRRVRLESVRQELLAADPDSTTVAVIARRWGFLALGRFAAAYRQQHGETPVATLRR